MTAYILLATEVAVGLLAASIVIFLALCAYVQTRDIRRTVRFLSLFGAFAFTCVLTSVAGAQESRESGVYDYARSTLDRKVIVEPGGKLRSEPVPPRTGRSIQYPPQRPQLVYPAGKERPLTDQELADIVKRSSNQRNR